MVEPIVKPYYVYVYLNPLKPGKYTYKTKMSNISFDFEPLYIGKGKDKRCFNHIKDALNYKNGNTYKEGYIRKIIQNSGIVLEENKTYSMGTVPQEVLNLFEPYIIILKEFENEVSAYRYEYNLIKHIGIRTAGTGPLTNIIVSGITIASSNMHNGKYVYDIPNDELICVKNLHKFNKLHQAHIENLWSVTSPAQIVCNRFCLPENKEKYLHYNDTYKLYGDNVEYEYSYYQILEGISRNEIDREVLNIIKKDNQRVSAGSLFLIKEQADDFYKKHILYGDGIQYEVTKCNHIEFCNKYGFSRGSIRNLLDGKYKVSYGLFLDEDSAKEYYSTLTLSNDVNTIEFIKGDTSKIANSLNISTGDLHALIRGKYNTMKGYHIVR